MEDVLSVGLYARVSSQRQADGLTIQSQVAALKQRIVDDGAALREELCFLDEGYSGSTIVRPGLEKLRDVAWAGGLDRLYVHTPDRLARKYVYQMVLLEELRKQGVEVIFLDHDPQDRSPEGELLLQVQGMIAEYERAKILERTRRGRRFAARKGKVSAIAHAPYGYRYVPKQESDGEGRYDIVPDEAQTVKEIFTWVAIEGLSLGGVVRRLAERGVRTATGKSCWDRATIHGILMQPAYTGVAKYGKTRLVARKPGGRVKRGDPQVPRQEKVAQATSANEQEPIPVPAIVSQELFHAVGKQLEKNRRTHREQKKGAEFLLGGLLVCHLCGSAYCGRRTPRKGSDTKYVYYRCLGTDKYRHGGQAICANKSINGERLEKSVWEDVCSLLQDPARLRREFERRMEQTADEQVDASHLSQSIAQLKQRIGRLIDAYENGWVDKADFEPRISRAKERLIREQQRHDVQHQHASSKEDLKLLIGQFEEFSERISTELGQADFETKRKLLRLIIQRIEIDEDEVRIIYKVQPPPFVPGPASTRGNLQHCLSLRTTPSA